MILKAMVQDLTPIAILTVDNGTTTFKFQIVDLSVSCILVIMWLTLQLLVTLQLDSLKTSMVGVHQERLRLWWQMSRIQ